MLASACAGCFMARKSIDAEGVQNFLHQSQDMSEKLAAPSNETINAVDEEEDEEEVATTESDDRSPGVRVRFNYKD
ncbi:hypothetical protein TKK_0000239 [Trichogramma kaykai]